MAPIEQALPQDKAAGCAQKRITYSRRELLVLSQSPNARAPEGMVSLSEWFGPWKIYTPRSSASPATVFRGREDLQGTFNRRDGQRVRRDDPTRFDAFLDRRKTSERGPPTRKQRSRADESGVWRREKTEEQQKSYDEPEWLADGPPAASEPRTDSIQEFKAQMREQERRERIAAGLEAPEPAAPPVQSAPQTARASQAAPTATAAPVEDPSGSRSSRFARFFGGDDKRSSNVNQITGAVEALDLRDIFTHVRQEPAKPSPAAPVQSESKAAPPAAASPVPAQSATPAASSAGGPSAADMESMKKVLALLQGSRPQSQESALMAAMMRPQAASGPATPGGASGMHAPPGMAMPPGMSGHLNMRGPPHMPLPPGLAAPHQGAGGPAGQEKPRRPDSAASMLRGDATPDKSGSATPQGPPGIPGGPSGHGGPGGHGGPPGMSMRMPPPPHGMPPGMFPHGMFPPGMIPPGMLPPSMMPPGMAPPPGMGAGAHAGAGAGAGAGAAPPGIGNPNVSGSAAPHGHVQQGHGQGPMPQGPSGGARPPWIGGSWPGVPEHSRNHT
ncbi:hypothetical protein MCUN1_001102 [Malassezia cuniculi]|uniref:Uncharacterized protein n=1 Tax=Malassezia cuniculi TaxID=948313 RepID=A0AAF0ES92_9BASI|nr:hypothetical protein MCUN1_001102 [Malassezia cuniculi]